MLPCASVTTKKKHRVWFILYQTDFLIFQRFRSNKNKDDVVSLENGGFNIWLFRYRKGKWERIFHLIILNLFSSSLSLLSFRLCARCRAMHTYFRFFIPKLSSSFCLSLCSRTQQNIEAIKIFNLSFVRAQFLAVFCFCLFIWNKETQTICACEILILKMLLWISKHKRAQVLDSNLKLITLNRCLSTFSPEKVHTQKMKPISNILQRKRHFDVPKDNVSLKLNLEQMKHPFDWNFCLALIWLLEENFLRFKQNWVLSGMFRPIYILHHFFWTSHVFCTAIFKRYTHYLYPRLMENMG